MIISDENLEPLIKTLRQRGNKIVLVGGCFDILHDAHIKFLGKSKQQGDILVLLLESDENIKRLKGENRPVNDVSKRAKALESLGFVDLIVKLPEEVSDDYYMNLTKLIQPDIIAITKNDPLTFIKKVQAERVGGKVVEVMERDENYSSTKLIKK